METKKSPKVNLEKKKIYFLEIGFILALGLCFAAFEWSKSEAIEISTKSSGDIEIIEDADIISVIIQPKEEKKQIVIVEKITITDDDNDFEEIETEWDEWDYTPPQREETEQIEVPLETPEIFDLSSVDKKPEFPGGEAALFKFISENIVYPEICKDNEIDGKVYVRFVIGINGKVSDISIQRGVDVDLDEEAARVISLLPDWKPGEKNNKIVPVSFIIPIKFVIE
jgi:protein TonB